MLLILTFILVPVVLFVVAFLYETYLSFARLKNPHKGKKEFIYATWEITHTVLIFAVIMLFMLFTKNIENIASIVFVPAFLAVLSLTIRSLSYLYIFYIRQKNIITGIDWIFALSHLVAGLFLIITVAKALWYILFNNPSINSQFIPYLLPGLLLTIALCTLPILTLYSTKK